MDTWIRPALRPALGRLDLLLQREILRLRARYQLSLDELRGLYVSDAQVDALLRQAPTGERPAGADPQSLTRQAEAARGQALESLSADPAWLRLLACYGLGPAEQEVVLLALAPELEPRYETLYAYLNDDLGRRQASLELALRLYGESDPQGLRALLSPAGRLMERGILEPVEEGAGGHALRTALRLSPVVREFLLGHPPFDSSLRSVAAWVPEPYLDWDRFALSEALVGTLSGLVGTLLNGASLPPVLLEASPESGRRRIAINLFAAAGMPVLELDLAALVPDTAARALQLTYLQQAAALADAGLVLDAPDTRDAAPPADLEPGGVLRELIASGRPLCLLARARSSLPRALEGMAVLRVPIPPLDARQRERAWRLSLAQSGLCADQDHLPELADFFHLEWEQIRAAAQALRWESDALGAGAHRATREALFDQARRQSLRDIGELAQRLVTDFTLDDLVLPPVVAVRIREVMAAVRNRHLVYEQWGMAERCGPAKGLVALFTGSSGTGKTMSAGVIANGLGLELYRIELSAIVSKYIGETEKNLDRIFAAARRANCILLFDEADALFGKRSEVKDAHDRYANLEVAYLLQKMESHQGVTLLTSNLPRGMDAAFTRRIQFVVEFPRPDQAMRERLWRRMFGPRAPLADDLDYRFLSRLDNTGGEIRNIALDAAMLAAAEEDPRIDMGLLVRACARQMRKQGKVPSAQEFKHYFDLVQTS